MRAELHEGEGGLAEAVADSLERCGELRLQREPLRTAIALRFDGLCVGALDRRLACAERELARLHCFESARLLRDAAALCQGADAADRRLRLTTLRAALREEQACLVADHARATAHLQALFTRCLKCEPEDWNATELALAALALRNDIASRTRLGEVLLAGAPRIVGDETAPARTRTQSLERAFEAFRRAAADGASTLHATAR